MCPVKIYDDRDRYRCFGGCDRDDENGKKDPVQPVGPQIFIEDHEIYIHAVQQQFHRHEDGDHIPAREQPVHPDEEKGRAYK
jgi:hypothetical protein